MIYDVRKVEELFLKQLKVPDGDSLLLPKPEVKEMNAVNENLAAAMARPIAAFPDQDHLAHLQVHLDFMQSPVLGSCRVTAPKALPILLEHLREHMVLWYVSHTIDVASEAAGQDISEIQRAMKPEDKKEFDRMLAAASQSVVNEANSTMEQIPKIIEATVKYLQSLAPPPQDPASELAKAELQRKQQADQQNAQIEQMKVQSNQQGDQARLSIEAMKQDREDQRKQSEIAARMKMNADDNDTAKQLAALEVASGERIAVSTGTGINPNP